MSITSEITRLSNAKTALRNSIIAKGVSVSEDAKIDTYADKVAEIAQGGGVTHTGHIDEAALASQGWTAEEIAKLREQIFWDAEDDNLWLPSVVTYVRSTSSTGKYTGYAPFFSTKFDTLAKGLAAGRFINLRSLRAIVIDFALHNEETSLYQMFSGCNSLYSLKLPNWNTLAVTNSSQMLYGCNCLEEIDISNIDLSNVTNASQMFYSCYKAKKIKIGKMTSIENIYAIFCQCTSLQEIEYADEFDTSHVTAMSQTFQSCNGMAVLDLTKWDTSNVTMMNNTFSTHVYIKGVIDMTSVVGGFTTAGQGTYKMFAASYPLVSVRIKNLGTSLQLGSCTMLDHDSLMYLINNAKDVTDGSILQLGTTNLNKLTADEKAIATNKGWTLA